VDNEPKNVLRIVADSLSSSRIYKAVANHVGKNSYRSDLNQAAVARASAIKLSQKEKKETSQKKPRGRKAKAMQEAERE
jgi:large subunit ribosomal protein L28e